MSYDYLFKFIIIGDQKVGKSTLLQRFTDDTFTEDHEPTVGIEFNYKMVSLMNKLIKLQVWDSVATTDPGRTRELPLYHSVLLQKVACDHPALSARCSCMT